MTHVDIVNRKQSSAVEFKHHGRLYRTSWTTFPTEASAWATIISETGWCPSARPLPAE